MNSIIHGTIGRSLASIGGTVLLALTVVACNNSSLTSPDSAATTADATTTAALIASELSLSANIGDSLGKALDCHVKGDPSQLWNLAVKLEDSLTAEQKQLLLSSGERKLDSMSHDADSMKCGRDSGDPRHGLQRLPANDMRGGDSAAMGAALGLTAEQQTALYNLRESQRAAIDSLEAQLKAGTIDEATFRSEMDKLRAAQDAALATILDARQLEILKIHDALVIRLHGPGPGGRGPGGPDDRGGRGGRGPGGRPGHN